MNKKDHQDLLEFSSLINMCFNGFISLISLFIGSVDQGMPYICSFVLLKKSSCRLGGARGVVEGDLIFSRRAYVIVISFTSHPSLFSHLIAS